MTTTPKEASMARDAYNLFGHNYIRHYPDDLSKFRPFADQFLCCLPRGGRIVDIGCGNGAYVKYYLEHNFDAIGIDISETMIEEARKSVPPSRLCLMDMHDMSHLESASFDGASCITSLLYTSKQQLPHILSQVHRILKPTGWLFLIMLEGNSEGPEPEEYSGLSATTYSAYYNANELKHWLTACGFTPTYTHLAKLVVLTKREIIILTKMTDKES